MKLSKGKLKVNINKLYGSWPDYRGHAIFPEGGNLEVSHLDDGLWHHYAFVDEGNYVYFYRDGIQLGKIRTSFMGTGKYLFENYAKFQLGNKGIAIDDLRIWANTQKISDMGDKFTGTAPVQYSFSEGPPNTYTLNGQGKGKLALQKTEWVLREVNFPKTVSTLDGSRPGNTALKFEEANNELIIPGEVDLANKSFTIEFWAKRQEVNRNDFIIGQGKSAQNEGLRIGFRANNQFAFDFYGDGVNAPALLETGWHHWAVTYDTKTKKQTIYKDGSKAAERTTNNHYRGKGTLQISKLFTGGHFKGILDELRIWSKARTSAEIKANYYKLVDASAPNLIRYFKFNDGKGSKKAGDMTGVGDLTLKNMDVNTDWVPGAPFTPIKSSPTKPKDNKVTTNSNNALDFDGVDDELTTAGNVDLSNKSFTIEFWAKQHALNQQNMILGQGKKETGKGLQIGFRANNKFTCNFYGDALDTPQPSGTDWYHWAIVYNQLDKKLLIYRDGEKIAEKNNYGPFRGTGDFLVGKDLFGNRFKGLLDDLRIWTIYRSSTQIKDNMDRPLVGNESGLARYYSFDMATGSNSVNDGTGKKALALRNMDSATDWVEVKRQPKVVGKIVAKDWALDFDGVDDYLEIDGFAGRNTGWTVEFWARSSSSSSGKIESLLEFGKPGVNRKIQIGFTKDDKFFIREYMDYYKRFLTATSTNKITNTNWHHWAIVAKPSTDNMLLYMDGKQVGEFLSGGYNYGGDRPLPGGKFYVNSRYGFHLKDK